MNLAKSTTPSDAMRDARPTTPLFKTRSLAFKVFAVVIAPPIYGMITGAALGSSAAAYWILIAIGVGFAIFSGYEHDEILPAVGRGCLSAALFTSGLLGILRITGSMPHVVLPAPVVFFPTNCIAGAIICAPGAWRRRRAERQAAVLS